MHDDITFRHEDENHNKIVKAWGVQKHDIVKFINDEDTALDRFWNHKRHNPYIWLHKWAMCVVGRKLTMFWVS